MFYTITAEDSRVVVKLESASGWFFDFSHETGHKAWAVLLRDSLRQKRDALETAGYKDAYNRGWADAKAKRRKAVA